jgi:uncharacterized protein
VRAWKQQWQTRLWYWLQGPDRRARPRWCAKWPAKACNTTQDPTGFIRGLDRTIIDEIQRAPALLLAIKQSVDQDRRPGRFLLTGSANLLALPTVADSLAGRMEIIHLLPLSQSELHGGTANWVNAAFEGKLLLPGQPVIGPDLVDAVLGGGYPEALTRSTPARKATWNRQYVQALLTRDVRDIAAIDKLDQLPRLLRALAQVSGQMCNYSQLGAQLGLDHKTVARYIGVFEHMYLLHRIEAWSKNRLKRMVKTPKLHFIDTGLLAQQASLTPATVALDRSRFGHALESFVASELLKHMSVANAGYQLLHYRDQDQYEVDLVLENEAGDIVGIEVKAAASIQAKDLRGLQRLASLAKTQFKLGVVLYDGTQTLPLGNGLWAAPIATLWGNACMP